MKWFRFKPSKFQVRTLSFTVFDASAEMVELSDERSLNEHWIRCFQVNHQK